MHTVDLLVCRVCGDRAEPLLVHRSVQTPLAVHLGSAWRYALSPQALLLAAGQATILSVLAFLTRAAMLVGRVAPLVLALGVFWSCFFAMLRASARGEKHVPLPDSSDFFADWLLPAFRGLLATSVVWLPLTLYFVHGEHARVSSAQVLDDPSLYTLARLLVVLWEPLREDPLAWLLVVVGLAYLPMALVLGAVGANPLTVFNPLRGLACIRRLGSDYLLTLGVLLVLGAVFLGVRWVGTGLRSLVGGVITFWLAEFIEAPVPFLMAHVLGLLVYTRGDVLGYGAPRDYLLPVLPDAAPRTTLHVEGLGTPEPVSTEKAQATSLQTRELAEAVRTRDVPAALSLYASLGLPPGAIPASIHLFVGQAAATYGDHALAVRALEAAADVAPDEPLAPKALVLLARVLGERMREPARAQEVYRYIVDRYPETDASRFAQAHLPPTT